MARKKILDSQQEPMKFHVFKELKEPNPRGIRSSKYGRPARIVIEFFRTSQFFDGLVNTPARILINAMSFFVLYVWGYNVLDKETNFFWWVFTLLVLLGMQAASVRFVFQTEGIADEFQSAKRDLAYRRAYRSLRRLTLIPIALFSLFIWGSKGNARALWEFIAYRLDAHRSLTVAVFLFAVISFQKYFSWGMKGEPFTIREIKN
jgi:hypothetical protein